MLDIYKKYSLDAQFFFHLMIEPTGRFNGNFG